MGKKSDILEATLELIYEEGLQSVTFSKIFKRAQVGSGTFYNYFQNKEELVNELYRVSRLNMARHTIIEADSSYTLYEKFTLLIKAMLKYAKEYPQEFLFIDSFSYSPYISVELRTMQEDEMTKGFVELFRHGVEEGLIEEIPIELAIQVIFGIVSTVFKGYFINKYTLSEQEINQIVKSCWKAVKL